MPACTHLFSNFTTKSNIRFSNTQNPRHLKPTSPPPPQYLPPVNNKFTPPSRRQNNMRVLAFFTPVFGFGAAAAILLFTSVLSANTASVSAACSSQDKCLHVMTHDCDSNFQRVVCVYWDTTDVGCSETGSFNNVCVTGDRARKWYQGKKVI
jgi:hypothetical protein